MTMTHDDITNDDDDGDHHTSIRQAVHDDVEETTMMTMIFFPEAVAKLRTYLVKRRCHPQCRSVWLIAFIAIATRCVHDPFQERLTPVGGSSDMSSSACALIGSTNLCASDLDALSASFSSQSRRVCPFRSSCSWKKRIW